MHNDFRQSHGLIPLFDGLEVKDIEKPLHVVKDIPTPNGNIRHDSTRSEIPKVEALET